MIPPLDHRGLLPEGVHEGTWKEVEQAFAINPLRVALIGSAKQFTMTQLAPLHPSPMYLAGSTFSDKVNPSDIEATIKVDPTGLTQAQAALVFNLQLSHRLIKQNTNVDFYVTLDQPGQNDFSSFFQYVGDKTAASKGLDSKDKRGLVEVKTWMIP